VPAAGLLLWARRVGDIDQLLHGRALSTGYFDTSTDSQIDSVQHVTIAICSQISSSNGSQTHFYVCPRKPGDSEIWMHEKSLSL